MWQGLQQYSIDKDSYIWYNIDILSRWRIQQDESEKLDKTIQVYYSTSMLLRHTAINNADNANLVGMIYVTKLGSVVS